MARKRIIKSDLKKLDRAYSIISSLYDKYYDSQIPTNGNGFQDELLGCSLASLDCIYQEYDPESYAPKLK